MSYELRKEQEVNISEDLHNAQAEQRQVMKFADLKPKTGSRKMTIEEAKKK